MDFILNEHGHFWKFIYESTELQPSTLEPQPLTSTLDTLPHAYGTTGSYIEWIELITWRSLLMMNLLRILRQTTLSLSRQEGSDIKGAEEGREVACLYK